MFEFLTIFQQTFGMVLRSCAHQINPHNLRNKRHKQQEQNTHESLIISHALCTYNIWSNDPISILKHSKSISRSLVNHTNKMK